MKRSRLIFASLCGMLLLALVAPRALAFTELYASVSNWHDSDPPGGILKINSAGVATVWNIDWGSSGVALATPQGLAFDIAGNLYIHDAGFIYKVTPQGNGSIFTTKPNAFSSNGLAVDSLGNVYATGSSPSADAVIYRYDSSGALTATW